MCLLYEGYYRVEEKTSQSYATKEESKEEVQRS